MKQTASSDDACVVRFYTVERRLKRVGMLFNLGSDVMHICLLLDSRVMKQMAMDSDL
ncbi:Uncharacterised protein [Yersinia nurmii]|uniref:Uncharacterized protein n=1 Tax=Yersinia nurmii TaxID=685706 RepID=A0ABM9S196_9GAMM|nr:hypothetical protein [Yersinia nurmii]CND88271.1 Uncharacterised protein [Yersinia nurmii]